MRKLFFISMLFLLGVACSQDDSLTATVDPVPEGGRDANPYAVTVEEALANLEGVLAQIDGETRAGGMRRAVSVDRVKAADVCDLTRSEAALDVEDLLYVVSFGEGNGSAVLGADKRVTQVMAVLDETVLTAEDFVKFDTRATSLEELSPKEDLQNMLTDMITATAEEEISTTDFEITLPEYPNPFIGYDSTYTYYNRTPLLATKWDQDSPYNNSCPYKTYSTLYHQPAGCVPIGVGQLLRYYEYPSPNVVDGTLYDWSLIGQLDYGVTATNLALAQSTTADYIYKIGCMMGADYTDDETGVYSYQRINFMKAMGYSNARDTSWSTDTAYETIYTNSQPLGIGAATTIGGKGHFWLLDGWKRTVAEYWRLEKRHPSQVLPIRILVSSETIDLVHCNFGWEGYFDGYYTPNSYDQRYRLSDENVDTSVGDIALSGGYNFAYDIRIMLLE